QNNIFTRILHFFPISGRSYMAPDRFFRRTEKDYRRTEDILTPNGYHIILENHGTVKNLNKDWKIMDFKIECSEEVNMVSKEKKNDVKKLMQYFEVTGEAKDFYTTVLADVSH
ncbi:hypothetical protein ANN_13049, partial [Periplaneta americana]